MYSYFNSENFQNLWCNISIEIISILMCSVYLYIVYIYLIKGKLKNEIFAPLQDVYKGNAIRYLSIARRSKKFRSTMSNKDSI